MREPRDAGDIQARTVAETDLGDSDELGTLVDQAREILEWNVAIGRPRYVDHLRAPALLRVPDLRVGRKLEVADYDLAARAGEIERAGERIDTRRGGCGHSNLIRRHPQHARHRFAHRLVLGDPDIPVGADGQAIVHVGIESIAYRIRQRAVGAAVEISLALEHRKPAPQRLEVGRHLAPLSITASCPEAARSFARRTK